MIRKKPSPKIPYGNSLKVSVSVYNKKFTLDESGNVVSETQEAYDLTNSTDISVSLTVGGQSGAKISCSFTKSTTQTNVLIVDIPSTLSIGGYGLLASGTDTTTSKNWQFSLRPSEFLEIVQHTSQAVITSEMTEGYYPVTGMLYLSDISVFLTQDDLTPYVKTSTLETTLEDYEKTSDLETTLEDYEKKSDLTTTLGDYAKKSDLSNYETKGETEEALENYQTILTSENEGDNISITTEDDVVKINCLVPAVDMSLYESKEELKTDLGSYYKKDETYSKNEIDTTFAKQVDIEDFVDEYDVEDMLDDYYTKEQIDKKGYLTSESDPVWESEKSSYYTKDDTYSKTEVDSKIGDINTLLSNI